LRLINLAFRKGTPNEWKTAVLTMIPKKTLRSNDPADYRPISLLSCISKVLERLVKTRLYTFLEISGIILKQQSGFRSNRGTTDNLFFFTQKISENLNKNRKACSIFFDISKAFDKVWHDGLIFKLNNLGVDNYLIRYLIDFLSQRKFKVKINNCYSKPCPIECGVPQGSVLGPLLFLVYINDIPLVDSKPLSYSSLFADDLSVTFTFSKDTRLVEKNINLYLENLVKWLFKWRLKMNVSKCCYIIFTKNGNKSNKSKGVDSIRLKLKMNEENIPYNRNPRFLGVTFDESLNFSTHIQDLRCRALKRIPIIKCLSKRFWHLSTKSLSQIYSSLIESLFNYSFFTKALISDSNLKLLQTIQDRAIRSIFSLKWNFPSVFLPAISGIAPLKDRFTQLGCRYIAKTILYKNPYILPLIKDYLDSISSIQRVKTNSTPLCVFLPRLGFAFGIKVFFFFIIFFYYLKISK